MAASYFDTQFKNALKAGRKRDYKKAIVILEDLAARGLAESGSGGNADVYLYLARSWHAEKMWARAAVCARSYIRQKPEDGSGWFFLGRSYLADGIFDRAVNAFQKSIQFNPQSIDARTLLGMTYLRARKPVLAKAVFEEALTLAPEDPRLNQGYLNALFVDAVHTFKKGDAETARQMLTFLINNDIDGVVPRLYLAHALRELGYLPEALSQYEAAIEFASDDEALQWYPVAILLEMGEGEKAAALMATLKGAAGMGGEAGANGGSAGIGGAPISDQMVNLTIIKNHLEQGEWANAAQAARSYIRAYGSDAQVHALMGEAQRNLGNREQSMNHFNRALDLDRQNPSPRYGILMLLVSARDWTTLRGELVKAERAGCDQDIIRYYRVLCEANLDAAPETLLPAIQEQVLVHGAVPELIVALARTYFRLGLADLASGWYQKAIDLESGNEEAHLGYIACCEELDLPEALGASYAAYLETWLDNQSIRRDYIRYLAGRERWESAADQTEILQEQDTSVSLDRTLALYRRKAGQYRKAAILYRNMLRAKPDDRPLLANLVFCLDRMGEAEAALRLMQEANRMFKPDAESLMIEGRLYERTGNLDAALTVFRKVVDAWPKDARGWLEISAIYTRQGVTEMAAVYAQKARDLSMKVKKG